jgi:hypothetical protein
MAWPARTWVGAGHQPGPGDFTAGDIPRPVLLCSMCDGRDTLSHIGRKLHNVARSRGCGQVHRSALNGHLLASGPFRPALSPVSQVRGQIGSTS